jgi:hypothetical protein
MLPLTAISMSATLAPRIDVYTILACKVLRPEYNTTADLPHLLSTQHQVAAPSFNHLSTITRNEPGPDRCATDPVVQAAVAKLTIGMFYVYITCRASHTGRAPGCMRPHTERSP